MIGGMLVVIGTLAIQLGAGGDHYPQIYNTRQAELLWPTGYFRYF